MCKGRRVLIQCIGNRWRGDDGAGPAVADRLRALGLGARVREYGGDVAALMLEWEGAECVFVVDAAQSTAVPGHLHHWDAHLEAIPRHFARSSTHRLDVADAVELARVLGRLPSALRIYAIEGACFAAGQALSKPVAAAVIRLAERLRGEIGR